MRMDPSRKRALSGPRWTLWPTAFSTVAAALYGLDAQESPLESRLRLYVLREAGAVRKRAFGALTGFFGAHDIDVLGPLNGIGEYGDAIVPHFQEASGDRHVDVLAALDDAHDAGLDRREERRVTWQHRELALAARRDDLLDALFGEDFPFRGDDVNAKWHGMRPAFLQPRRT
jgi:hypothetical protein